MLFEEYLERPAYKELIRSNTSYGISRLYFLIGGMDVTTRISIESSSALISDSGIDEIV